MPKFVACINKANRRAILSVNVHDNHMDHALLVHVSRAAPSHGTPTCSVSRKAGLAAVPVLFVGRAIIRPD